MMFPMTGAIVYEEGGYCNKAAPPYIHNPPIFISLMARMTISCKSSFSPPKQILLLLDLRSLT